VTLTPNNDSIVELNELGFFGLVDDNGEEVTRYNHRYETPLYTVRPGEGGNGVLIKILDNEWRWETVPENHAPTFPAGSGMALVDVYWDSAVVFTPGNPGKLLFDYYAAKKRVGPQSPLDGQNTIWVYGWGSYKDTGSIYSTYYRSKAEQTFTFDYD